jgi:hypothetical protein
MICINVTWTIDIEMFGSALDFICQWFDLGFDSVNVHFVWKSDEGLAVFFSITDRTIGRFNHKFQYHEVLVFHISVSFMQAMIAE